jgi:hypothetical protein
VSEQKLEGGDLNVVVRVGDTVRRPTARWSPAVHALLRHFEEAARYGLPTEGRGERLRAICDAYGLDERGSVVEWALAQRRSGYELHRELGGEQRQPGWREMWDAGSGGTILAGVRWLEENRAELEHWL